jgi:hypothetical protein
MVSLSSDTLAVLDHSGCKSEHIGGGVSASAGCFSCSNAAAQRIAQLPEGRCKLPLVYSIALIGGTALLLSNHVCCVSIFWWTACQCLQKDTYIFVPTTATALLSPGCILHCRCNAQHHFSAAYLECLSHGGVGSVAMHAKVECMYKIHTCTYADAQARAWAGNVCCPSRRMLENASEEEIALIHGDPHSSQQ